MLWLVLLLTGLFLYWLYDTYYNSHQYRLGKDIPGYKTWPIIGSAHLISEIPEEAHKFYTRTGELALQNDGVYAVWVGPQLISFLTDVNDVETVLNKCLNKPFQYDFFNEVMGSGLITLRDAVTWKRHRKIIQPTFNIQILNNFVQIMDSNSMNLVRLLESEVGKGKTDFLVTLGDTILDSLLATLMDWKADEPYTDVFKLTPTEIEAELSTFAITRTTKLWQWCDAIFYKTPRGKTYKGYQDTINNYMKKIFSDKCETLTKMSNGDSSTKYLDSTSCPEEKCFLNNLITNQPRKFTDDEIMQEMRTMLIAGFDTSSVSLSFALMLIGSYPDVQNKLYEELSSIYQGSNRPIVKEDLAQMTYLEYVIKEVLRLYPPAPLFGRDITTDVKLRNCTLPAGSSAFVLNWTIHRDEKIWGPDASEFKPERWMADKKHPCAYLPFSYGPRNCIGTRYAMTMSKIVLANMLRNYEINADISSAKIGLEILLKPTNGFNIELIKRN